MQWALGFESGDVAAWSVRLLAAFGDPLPVRRRTPLGQLVKSIISSRTRDAVSTAAYNRLAIAFPRLGLLADATPDRVLRLIAPVTFPEDKANYLINAMLRIGAERPDYDLDFLGQLPLSRALAWLEALPGVARKVAASTLNASTLDRPVFIVDTHVLRVLARLGFVEEKAGYRAASEAVTAAMPRWKGSDFLRFHILMKRLGQTLCRHDAADCARCPLGAPALRAARCRHADGLTSAHHSERIARKVRRK